MSAPDIIEALRVTQAAGLRLRLLPCPGEAAVSCPRCDASWDVVLAKWVALKPVERGCFVCKAKEDERA
jgi:hypothetical protein